MNWRECATKQNYRSRSTVYRFFQFISDEHTLVLADTFNRLKLDVKQCDFEQARTWLLNSMEI